jgi:hypothetical protein
MAFKVAGRFPSAGNNAAAPQKPATDTAAQQSFGFKPATSSPTTSASKAPPTRPASQGPAPAQMRRPAPAAPPKLPAQPAKIDKSRWQGRSEAPPPRSRSYAEYFEWAADGMIPDESTAALALDYYLGIRADEEPEETSTFRP